VLGREQLDIQSLWVFVDDRPKLFSCPTWCGLLEQEDRRWANQAAIGLIPRRPAVAVVLFATNIQRAGTDGTAVEGVLK
jgi:hypothetical protein